MLRGLLVAVAFAGLAASDVAWAGGGDSQDGSTPFCQPINGFYCKSIVVFGCAPMSEPEGVTMPQPVGSFFDLAVLDGLENAFSVLREKLCPMAVTAIGGGCPGMTGFQVIREGGLLGRPEKDLLAPPPTGCRVGEFRVDLRVWYLAPVYQNQQ